MSSAALRRKWKARKSRNPSPDSAADLMVRPAVRCCHASGISSDDGRGVAHLRVLAKRTTPTWRRLRSNGNAAPSSCCRINIAYRDHNLAALQALMLEVHMDLPLVPSGPLQAADVVGQARVEAPGARAAGDEHRIDSLLASDTYTLWMSELDGQSALDDLERRTRRAPATRAEPPRRGIVAIRPHGGKAAR